MNDMTLLYAIILGFIFVCLFIVVIGTGFFALALVSRYRYATDSMIAYIALALLPFISIFSLFFLWRFGDMSSYQVLMNKPFGVFILYIGWCFLWAVRFSQLQRIGKEAVLLNLQRKDTFFCLSMFGNNSQTKKLSRISYEFQANGQTYRAKKYIASDKIVNLKRVVYDPSNPERNIPVPKKTQDRINH